MKTSEKYRSIVASTDITALYVMPINVLAYIVQEISTLSPFFALHAESESRPLRFRFTQQLRKDAISREFIRVYNSNG